MLRRRNAHVTGCAWAALALAILAVDAAAQPGADAIPIDANDIAGVVTSERGPEAGVWVIAETDDLPTRFRRIVVTDDEGRYLIPDLPPANYDLWVRGYGLVDSPRVQTMPGRLVALAAVVAPDARAAAQYYPANHWYSLVELPTPAQFPGTGAAGNGIEPGMVSQHHWINQIKTGCNVCHQMGNLATRAFPPGLGRFETAYDAWDHRMQVGQDGTSMIAAINALGRTPALTMFADWTNRIAAGEVPPAPPRPQGLERNLVLTLWEWGGAATFTHDELSTDKRNPTFNAHGPIYGFDWTNDAFLMLDPNTHTVTERRIPVLDPDMPPGKSPVMPRPSPYWGDEVYWQGQAITNHAAMDSQGRVWMASRFRRPENQPEYCTDHPSARLSPQLTNFRGVQYYDPRTATFHQVDTCFDTHHVQFAADDDETLYGNGVFSGAIGWVNTRMLDETGDLAAAQGWCMPHFDVDGDGRIEPGVDRYVFEHLGRPTGTLAGMRIPAGVLYSVIAHPTDGSVWTAVPGPMPGRIVRIDPETCVSEVYEPPFNNPAVNVNGYTPRGIDVDSHGVIWTALAGSGHLASFDRRKCRVLTGAEAMTGQHCPEGWTLYRSPGPHFRGATDAIAVDMHYYNFVDRFNTAGLGPNVPFANGTNSDSLLALLPDGRWLVLRVPYPQGFFTRGMSGRIDDPDGGWKGRGLYATYGPNSPWHIEGGLGTPNSLVKFQLRPDPLAN
jgi:hypothetical protein